MKTRIFLLTGIFLCLIFADSLIAQVTSVNYQLKYDTTLCRYDAYLIVNSGSATTAARRIQFNSQFTIVVPTGVSLSVAASHMPLLDNAAGGGTVPPKVANTWSITSSALSPAAQPESDFYSIVPNLAAVSHYNNLNSGDTVKLFSLNIGTIANCGQGIRIFNNATDPNSSAPGMGGSDFRNGFTIGNATQRYLGNSTQVNPPKPVIASAVTTCSGGVEIDLTASTTGCQDPLTYAWTGPNSYVGTSQDVSINPANLNNIGNYKVVITDLLGCKDSVTIAATNKPDAGADRTVCAGTTQTISGINPTTGTWSARSGNPSGATLGALPGGQASVTLSASASGAYGFVYTVVSGAASCSDTMVINVNPLPNPIITGSNSICVGSTTTLSPTSGGTWASNNLAVATVNATTGVVTAVGQGTATFTFTSTTGCSRASAPVTVNPKPTVAVAGSPAVCIGGTTNVTPSTGGTWVAAFPAIGTITNAGLVTGVSAGIAKFIYTDATTLCVSDSISVEVKAKPTATFSGPTTICVLTTTQLQPSTGGTWSSSNPAVATVSNSGLVTGLTAGTVTFIYTETATGCSSNPSGTLTVVARPVVSITGSNVICVNATTALSPTTGGTWTSSNPAIATVTDAGVVTGVASGSVTFTFTLTATGCSSTTLPVQINPLPTVIAANPNVCIGSTTTLSPSAGGTWVSLNTGVATVTSAGVVTGVSSGTATMRFTEAGSGCQNTLVITVTPRPTVSITGLSSFCVGETTQLSPSTGGTWSSTNPTVATVNNAGLVTGISVGTATFIFTSSTTLCPSLPTNPVTVKNKPVVAVTGPSGICVGFTSQLSPTTGGTWVSNTPGVATVNNAGVVTAVSPGSATFTFTETGGCISDATTPITVYLNPVTSFTGPSSICVGSTTTVTPTTAGTWSSSNPAVATITNAGLVTGISAGTAQLVYTQTATGCQSTPLTVTISSKQTITMSPASICIGGTINLTPSTGGTWTTTNPTVATVTLAGVVTGVAGGTANLIFTTTAGCPSDPFTGISVTPRPTVTITGPSGICIGATTTLSASTTGTWTSNNPLIATVNASTGVVTGVAEGTATFYFTSTAGCISLPTGVITVHPKPITVINGANSICVGRTTQLSPTTGGTWTSSNPAVASITPTGVVLGVSVGTAKFVFTNSTTLCSSDSSGVVTITTGPSVTIGATELCIGQTTNLTPNSGGTWLSSNPAVASVTNAGVVTALSQGAVTFTFTDAAGCKSQPTSTLNVNGRPTVSVSGNPNICIGGTTTLSPNTGGTWAIASGSGFVSINSSTGVVTGTAAGSATFIFTLTATGCPSLPTSPVNVTAAPIVSITGPTAICVNGTTTLSPTTGGTWVSNNPTVASVNNSGVVTAIGPGKVTFTFTNTATGCASASPTGEVTVTHCFNPDINATYVGITVPGNLSTNDNVSVGTTYDNTNKVVLSTPASSTHTLTIAADGTYTFVADRIGVYVFEVPVCIPPQTSGCPRSLLTITVADYKRPNKQPIANTDFASTKKNVAVTLNTLANDRCHVIGGCTLDPALVTISVAPSRGTANANSGTGNITYTPNNNFVGQDTLTYQVCVTGEPSNCVTAVQIITVTETIADNTTIAADDFTITPQETAVSGNVQTNDSDPEGQPQTVTANTYTVPEGVLVLQSSGAYTFTPAPWFFGPVEFVYTTCDNNAPTNACANATLHILVVRDLTINIKVFLEGSVFQTSPTKPTEYADGLPLMRDNLRVSEFNGARNIPNLNPYKIPVSDANNNGPLGYDFTPSFSHIGTGSSASKFDTITNPSTIFAVTGKNAIVDWVFVELRSKTDNTQILSSRAGLLKRNGHVVDLDGIHGLRFPGTNVDDYYVVIRHHSHLGAMSKFAQTPTQLFDIVNFTTSALPTFDFGTTHQNPVDYTGLAQKSSTVHGIDGLPPGYFALWAGDFDGNGKIKLDNPGDDMGPLQFNVVNYPTNTALNANYDFAYGYLAGDYDMNGKCKFDNPDDDKNYLYYQLLFYPSNTDNLTNYDFFIQQIP